jgi:hypothetical protein
MPALWACQKRPEAPDRAVAAFFAAAAARDCAAVKALAARSLPVAEDGSCARFFRDLAQHQVRYEAATKVMADGRDPEARLVEATMSFDDRARPRIVRVERSGGRWKVASF